jgi:uncharacterized protein
MPYFVLLYDVVDNFIERRQPFRPAHLAHVDAAHRDGTLLLAGALKPADGALLLFRSDSSAPVEGFASQDPYVVNGVVTRWRVREWSVVVGEGAIPRS